MIKNAFRKLWITFLSKTNRGVYMKAYIKLLRDKGVDVKGRPVYVAPDVRFDNADYSIISIGDKCVISFGVTLLVHDYSVARALNAIGEDVEREPYIKRPVTVGDNCFVGCHSILCPGTHLGKDCIVGAGSVVRAGDYPDGSILTGNPAVVTGNTYDWGEKKRAGHNYCVNEHPTALY